MVKQQRYCRRAIGINRFVYNLCVATHHFCRANRLPWPSWQDLYKAFNACKREDYPFATTVASRVAEGAFMDFGTAIKNWRDTDHQAGPPRFHKKRSTGTGSFRAASGISQVKYNGNRRIPDPWPRFRQAAAHTAQGHRPRGTHQVPERPVDYQNLSTISEIG